MPKARRAGPRDIQEDRGAHDTLNARHRLKFCMSVVLTSAQNRFLRGQAHGLKAVLQTGAKGLTDAFFAELEEVLERHELIKVKLAAEDRQARDAMVEQVAGRLGAAVVQRIGHVAVLYRPGRDKRNIVLPRA